MASPIWQADGAGAPTTTDSDLHLRCAPPWCHGCTRMAGRWCRRTDNDGLGSPSALCAPVVSRLHPYGRPMVPAHRQRRTRISICAVRPRGVTAAPVWQADGAGAPTTTDSDLHLRCAPPWCHGCTRMAGRWCRRTDNDGLGSPSALCAPVVSRLHPYGMPMMPARRQRRTRRDGGFQRQPNARLTLRARWLMGHCQRERHVRFQCRR